MRNCLSTKLVMFDENAFIELISQIMAQGIDRVTAVRYAVLIGDLPITDENVSLLVMEGERVLATLKPFKIFRSP